MKVRYRGITPLFEAGLHIRPGGTYDIPVSVIAKYPRETFTAIAEWSRAPIAPRAIVLPPVVAAQPAAEPATVDDVHDAAVDSDDEPDKKGRKRRGRG